MSKDLSYPPDWESNYTLAKGNPFLMHDFLKSFIIDTRSDWDNDEFTNRLLFLKWKWKEEGREEQALKSFIDRSKN